jgi:acyl-CoA synthetase (NDP forming)
MPESNSIDDPTKRTELARALFTPRSIALLGVSDDPQRLTSRPQRVLYRHGYAGSVVPIHPTRDVIGGERAFRSIEAVPYGVDHAFIMLPASAVGDCIERCGRAGVKVATIVTAGFAELGASGRERQNAVVQAARRTGMRLLGPNCLGVVNVNDKVTLSANAVLEHESLCPGGVSVVSQSGSMLGAIISRAQERGIGFAKLISVGNECDIAVGELVHLLVDDPNTRAILLFLESFRDARVLGQAARRAYAAGKPVIAYKLGRTGAGRNVATTHTGAIAGPDEVADAFFAHHGILRVRHFEALFEATQLVLGQRPPTGRRVGILTVSGGGAAMVVDQLSLAHVDVVPPPPRIIENLAAKRIRVSDALITDLPMGRADDGAYATILNELLASDHCDAVVAILGSNATYIPESTRERVLTVRRGAKPLAVFVAPRAHEAMRMLQEGGVASFRTPEACADAIRAYCDWQPPREPLVIAPDRLALIKSAAAAASGRALNETDSMKLFAELGIECAPSQVVTRQTQSIDIAYPLAAKILSPDIAHKSAVGAVVLNIVDRRALADAAATLLSHVKRLRPDARIDGVLVQTMQSGLAEVIVGLHHDLEVGPIVTVGTGGVHAEFHLDHVVRLAPVSESEALAMIHACAGLTHLLGHRNQPAGDIAALARLIHTLSLLALADRPRVLDAEINPVIVRADGAVAVDALVRIE